MEKSSERGEKNEGAGSRKEDHDSSEATGLEKVPPSPQSFLSPERKKELVVAKKVKTSRNIKTKAQAQAQGL